MVDTDQLLNMDYDFGSIASGIINWVLSGAGILLLVVICATIVYVVWYISQFQHKARIYKLTGTKRVVLDDKFRVYKDRERTEWWQFLRGREKIAPAPADAINITNKGKMSVEWYYTDEGEYQARIHRTNPENMPKNKIVQAEKLTKWRKEKVFIPLEDTNTTVSGVEPLITKQRVLHINQYRKADERRRTSVWEKNATLIIGGIIFVLILGLLLMFWDDITSPTVKLAEFNANALDRIADIVQDLKEIKLDIQKIEGREAG